MIFTIKTKTKENWRDDLNRVIKERRQLPHHGGGVSLPHDLQQMTYFSLERGEETW